MTFGAAGAFLFADSSGLAVSNQGAGNLLLVSVSNYSNNTVWCSSLSGGGATWTQVGVKFASSVSATWYHAMFAGTVTATGAGTVTPAWSGTAPAGWEINGHEFTSTVGSWLLDVQGNLDGGGTNSWPSLTPAASGELYFGAVGCTGTGAVAGSTTGYVYSVNADSDACAYRLSCPAGTATFPVWGDSTHRTGIVVLMQETAGGAGIPAVLASAAGTAQTAGTSPHSALAGPAYAGTATDLGGGSGAWGTPQYAEGGP